MSWRNVHHRWPKSKHGPTNRWNCCKVDAKRHNLWHCLFGNMTGEEIAEEVNRCWLDPRYKLIVVPNNERSGIS